MSSNEGTTLQQEIEKDFFYYVARVRDATWLYDKAIENVTNDPGNPMALINVPELLQCQQISSELLRDSELPCEHRILLNYYMAAQQDRYLSISYLEKALEVVETLEVVEGVNDPMREVLETQLKDAISRTYLPSTPIRAIERGYYTPDCFSRNYFDHQILRQRPNSAPLPSLGFETTREQLLVPGIGFSTPVAIQAQSNDLPLRSSGPEIVRETRVDRRKGFKTNGQGTPTGSPIAFDAPKNRQQRRRGSKWYPSIRRAVKGKAANSGQPCPKSETLPARHLGDGMVFDASHCTQSAGSLPGFRARDDDYQGQPNIIVTSEESPDVRPAIIRKIRSATFRREMEEMERRAGGCAKSA